MVVAKPTVEDLAWRCQEEQRTLETDDLTSLVIRALCHYATSATNNGESPLAIAASHMIISQPPAPRATLLLV